MTDYTPLQLIVYACPEDQLSAVMELIDEYRLTENMPDGDALEFGHAYSNYEITCGSAEQLADALQEYAPGASWRVWEDPKYEWLGDTWMHAPELGVYRADCDANGQPVLTKAAVRKILSQLPEAMHQQVEEAIDQAYGTAWEQAFAKLTGKGADT